MHTSILQHCWQDAPLFLRRSLLFCVTRQETSLELGMQGLEAAPAWSWAGDALLAAWEADTTNTDMARQLAALPPSLLPASQTQRTTLAQCGAQRAAPELLAWRNADMCWQAGDVAAALPLYQQIGHWLTAAERAGHCHAALGETSRALELWRNVLRTRPWHSALALTCYAYARGLHQPLAAPAGSTAVVVTGDADDAALCATFESLLANAPDMATLLYMAPPSRSDARESLLKHYATCFGEKWYCQCLSARLGEPAERNWAAQYATVAACDYILYLSAGMALPPAGLRHLARAVQEMPAAQAWGCRIAAPNAPSAPVGTTPTLPLPPAMPSTMLSADAYLAVHFDRASLVDAAQRPEPIAPAQDAAVLFSPHYAAGEPFSLPQLSGADYGAHSYLRPCACVDPRCCLYRTSLLREVPFSLNFSPAAIYTEEQHLRLLARGAYIGYTGFCTATWHGSDAADAGNTLANTYKLCGLYTPEDIVRIADAQTDLLLQDLLQKIPYLDSLFSA